MWSCSKTPNAPDKWFSDPYSAIQNCAPDAQFMWTDYPKQRHIHFEALFNACLDDVMPWAVMSADRDNYEQMKRWAHMSACPRSLLGVFRHASMAMKDGAEAFCRAVLYVNCGLFLDDLS